MLLPRYLHVANGTSVTMTLEAAGVPGIMSIWGDPLHDGPVPAGLSDDELREMRGRHLSGDATLDLDPVVDMRRWRQVIAAHESYDELVLWYEHDLFDQLNLIQLLTWIRAHVPREKPVSLICIGSFPGRPAFKGLGELTAAELAPLLETRRPVTDREYALSERAWRAFREPTPEALDDLRRTDTTAMPFLAPALERLLQEYPWTRDGLSRTERRLLGIADGGPATMNSVFPRMHEDEKAYYVADLELKSLVETLSATSPPLVAFAPDANGSGKFWRGTVSVTDTGREVLAGRRDRVACGLDKWLGGVHLQSGAGDIWRWDGERGRTTQSRKAR
jgi:hypothetical protein